MLIPISVPSLSGVQPVFISILFSVPWVITICSHCQSYMHFTQQVTSKLTTNETTENQITHRNVYIGSLLYNTNSLCTDCYVDARTGLLSVGNERCIVVLSFPPNHSHALSHFHETTPVLPISTRTFPWDSHEIDGISDIDSSQQACTYSGSVCG